MNDRLKTKKEFEAQLKFFVAGLQEYISTDDGQWTIKDFIDVFQHIYTISADAKIVSKILEIHLFPQIIEFAKRQGYRIVLADHQNYYPDLSFVKIEDETIKFAVDFKTTYRVPDKSHLCNGFTLGSHGKYFEDRTSTKNIQFPYSSYLGHFCLGIIYSRVDGVTINETKVYSVGELQSITSVITDFQFFIAEKWRIASDKSGSGNTARKNEYVDSLWGDFNILTREHFYHVGANEKNRNPMIEAIITNFDTPLDTYAEPSTPVQLRLLEERANYAVETYPEK